MKEMDLLNEIRLKLEDFKCKTFRCNVGKVRTPDNRYFDTGLPPGFSDLLVIRSDGKACFIETKVKPRKPTKEQCLFLLEMIKRGCPAGVAFTVEQAIDIIHWSIPTSEYYRKYISSVLEGYK